MFDARVDRRPAAIARCRTRDDVIGALDFAVEAGLPVAVRGGGTTESATVDDGIVIDLSPLDEVSVDHAAATARVGGGATWADMDAATQEHGLAVTGARITGLGVAGVTLTGGSGWLERALGPTCQSLIGAEVVLADGRVATVGDEDNPELLWALRGGGGGLGVVTELEFRLHPVGPQLLAGFLTFPRERAMEVAARYRDFMRDAPADVGGALVLGAGVGGACRIAFSFAGPIDAGEEAVKPLRALGPSMDAVRPNDYCALQYMSDAQNPYGTRVHLGGGSLAELGDEALAGVIAAANRPAASLSYVLLRPLGGALSRIRADEMALDAPGEGWACECYGLWPPVESLDRGAIEWVEGVGEAIAPHATAPARRHDVHERLARIRERWDPGGVFARQPTP